MRLHLAARTDVGLTRSHNEDAYLCWDLLAGHALEEEHRTALDAARHAYMLAVSDGMGGARSGEIASRTALESLRSYARRTFRAAESDPGDGSLTAWLVRGIVEANRTVHGESEADVTLRGMGATLTVVGLVHRRWVVAHVGDSRAYLLREDRLRQLTMDHTHVQELVASGRITSEDARTDDRRNLLMQAIGPADSVEVDDLAVPALPGDRVLLCSDGLHGMVSDEGIVAVLSGATEPPEQCRRLIDRANAAGGSDNITVVVAHLLEAA